MIPLIGPILEIINKFVPDTDKQAEVKLALIAKESELEQIFNTYSKRDHELRIKELEFTGFKASWRPTIMFALSAMMVLYLFMFYILPQIIVVFNIDTYYLEPIEMPSVVWQVFAFCIVGIGGLRTIDKWRQK